MESLNEMSPLRHSRWFLLYACKTLYQPRPNRRMYSLTSAFLLPAARKRASDVRNTHLFAELILSHLVSDVLGYLCLILTHCVDIVTTAPEFPIATLELQLAELFVYHQTALLF